MKLKKFSGRVAAVAATMALVATLTAVSASAADYPRDPNYSIPVDTVVSSTTDIREAPQLPTTATNDTTGAAAQQSTATVLTADTVSEAVKEAEDSSDPLAVVQMGKNPVLKEEALAAVAKSSVPVTIVSQTSSGISYGVTLDPAEVAKVNGSVNLGLNIEKAAGNGKVNGVAVSEGDVVIKPKSSKGFGMDCYVTVPADVFADLNGTLAVFAIDANGNVVKLSENDYVVGNDGSITVKTDGTVSIVVSNKDLTQTKSSSATKATGAKPGTGKGVAALGLIDASAISVAAILAKKKKKK